MQQREYGNTGEMLSIIGFAELLRDTWEIRSHACPFIRPMPIGSARWQRLVAYGYSHLWRRRIALDELDGFGSNDP